MPRTIAVALDFRANSAVRPEKASTNIVHSLVSTEGNASRIISHRSSAVNIGLLSRLFKTAMIISSKSGADRLMMSRCPFVRGSNDPGKTARRISKVRLQHFLYLRHLLFIFRQIFGVRPHLEHIIQMLLG